MPDLDHTLRENDAGFLRIVANGWGIEQNPGDLQTGAIELSLAILNQELVLEMVESLPPSARAALDKVSAEGGRLSAARFFREFGDLRVMGAARRDRDRPDLSPASTAEILWYKALIGKAFFETDGQTDEFIYIPDDLLPLLPLRQPEPIKPFGERIDPSETMKIRLANDLILDQACDLLAILRSGDPKRLEAIKWRIPTKMLTTLLKGVGLVDSVGMPNPDSARSFLRSPRASALLWLTSAWQESKGFNELRLVPGLEFEGDWSNNPVLTRKTVIDWIRQMPAGVWWNIDSFIQEAQKKQPDFLRSAGEYETWFIRRQKDGAYLSGFFHWPEVEGALLRFFIAGPMHWLGYLDLAFESSKGRPAAMRLSSWSEDLFLGRELTGLTMETDRFQVDSHGNIIVSRRTPRLVRYSLARFCEWKKDLPGGQLLAVTSSSLEKASSQGLRASQLLSLLRKHSQGLPLNLAKALEKWEKLGAEGSIQKAALLKVSDPRVIDQLQKSSAGRFLGERLNENCIQIHNGAEKNVERALVELGHLFKIEKDQEAEGYDG